MGLAPYPWLERPAEVLSKMLGKLPGGVLIYGPRGCGVFELASRFAAAVVCQHPVDGRAMRNLRGVQTHLQRKPSGPSLRIKRNRSRASS